MGYRDDFYIAANITGYTGALYQKPSVYFQSATEEGRITQEHDDPDNVGRNKVRSSVGYTHTNVNIPGKGMRSVETRASGANHTSRNVFILASTCDDRGLAMLAQAIYNFPDRKNK